MNNKTTDTYIFPNLDDPKYADPLDFLDEIESLIDTDLYDEYVPDEEVEVTGAQRDLDDFDEYLVNMQEVIDEETFAERFIDKMAGEFDEGENVSISALKDTAESIAESIAQDALDSWDGDDDHLVHRGTYKSEQYWRS